MLTGTVLLILWLGGPFYRPICAPGQHGVVTQFIANDGHLYTASGKLNPGGSGFEATGRGGALLFGPYASLPPGRYRVTWYGEVQSPSAPRFDIVSAPGARTLAQAEVALPGPSGSAGGHPAALHSLTFATTTPVEGVETRVLVRENDRLVVSKVRLEAESCN
ncbi:hypothetical protein JJQ59_14600 [Cupriavidus necator]|uniref:hypothetical protein n=1 Tax=Cupriavidus necator TaxID=106590 RepID=UPI0011BD7563|nr:hypothetical protein [Cupriavidus necator]QQX83634.1 hypothetical protein JJQ59_14600 [Cupriavidus necator]